MVLAPDSRWDLYKVLGERQRLRLLALSAVEELSIGELAELLGESQSNVSRQLAPLRRLGLLAERRQGTRVFVHLADGADLDPVVADALRSGRGLCEADGVLARIPALVLRRDAASRAFFSQANAVPDHTAFADELPAYLYAVAPLIPKRRLAVDVGTGDGRLLDVLSPLFEQVVALDREQAQLAQAQVRVQARGYRNVELMSTDVGGRDMAEVVARHGYADVVVASRFLHHAPRPGETVQALAGMLGVGGSLVILDYAAHQDERMREAQADLWLGFAPEELHGYARRAGLTGVNITLVPATYAGSGPDSHLQWQILTACRQRGPDAPKTDEGDD